jgi:hypothetical protein
MSPAQIAPYSPASSTLWKLDPQSAEKGATAIALVAPTNSAADLGVGLSETYREGLPSLPGIQSWKQRTKVARAAGSEFLNAEFGWLPLVSEIKDVGHAVIHSSDILDQYHKDEGRNVHRTFSYPDEHTSSSALLGNLPPGFIPEESMPYSVFRTGGAKLTQTVETVTKRWFSGCFTYALPSSSDAWGGMQRNAADANHLLGLSLTPDIVWELTPWSWAIDWFSNAGNVIHNVTEFGLQGLVMRYGYMMTEKVTTITHRLSSTGLVGLSSCPPSTYIITSKQRSEASPFGFGVSWQGLSPLQLAISAAVGITKLR